VISSPLELKKALGAGAVEEVFGTPESGWIDFKKEPYRLDTFKGKWEYAKDVAALANGDGGCLVVGIKTGRSPNQLVSAAESCAPVPKKLVDQKQYVDVLLNGVYPEVWGVGFSWFPPDDSADAGVLLIEVPPQRRRDKPFVMRTMLGPEDRQVSAIGVPVRNGSETTWLKAERVQPLLGALSGAESELEAPRSARRDRADEIIATLRRESEWTEVPVLFLQAFPPEGRSVLPELYGRDGIRGALESPKARRYAGFDLWVAGAVTVRDGALVKMDSRKALWLERDGALTAAGLAGPEFLGWAMNERGQTAGPFTLNPVAVVEYVFEFVSFVYDVLAPRAARGRWTFRVAAAGWKSLRGGLMLVPGHPQDAWSEGAEPASGDALDDEVEGSGEPGRDALSLLGRLYGLFGLPSSAIPFTEGDAVSLKLLPK
jgi:hypothetical protein